MTPHGADLTRVGSEPMEIKITIEDIEENELRTYGRLGKVFAHLLGEGTVSMTPSMEGEESSEAVEDQPSQPKKQKLPCAWCGRKFNTPAQLNKHLGFCSENPNNESTKETKTCTMCGATETPQWRRMAEPDGKGRCQRTDGMLGGGKSVAGLRRIAPPGDWQRHGAWPHGRQG